MTLYPAPAVYACDEPVEDLRTAKLLLLTTPRLFAAAWRTPGESQPDWRGGLLRSRAPAWTASAFDGLLGIIAVSARQSLAGWLPPASRRVAMAPAEALARGLVLVH